MMADPKASSVRGAVLQFEFDRNRVGNMSLTTGYDKVTVNSHAHDVIRGALHDTIHHGGTFVCVVAPDKITVVQRPDAEEI